MGRRRKIERVGDETDEIDQLMMGEKKLGGKFGRQMEGE